MFRNAPDRTSIAIMNSHTAKALGKKLTAGDLAPPLEL